MADRRCSIEGCENPHYGRGWCNRHYRRWRRHGDPLAGRCDRLPWPVNLLTRMEAQPDGCVYFMGSPDPTTGYGSITRCDGDAIGAHRAIYELIVGPIPEGHEIDHECHNRDASCAGGPTCLHRRCVNWRHLVPKPPGDNSRASHLTVNAINAAKTHCIHGHEFTPENTYIRPDHGTRQCRMCSRDRDRRRVRRRL